MPMRMLPFDTATQLAEFATNGESVSAAAVSDGGEDYTLNDILTVISPGTVAAATLKVTGVALGVITNVSVVGEGAYSATPTNPVTVSGGTGRNAEFNLTLGAAMTQTDVVGINYKDGFWHLEYWV